MYKDHLIEIIESSKLQESAELLSIVESTSSVDELEVIESYVTERFEGNDRFTELSAEIKEISAKLKRAKADKDPEAMRTQIGLLKNMADELESEIKDLSDKYGDGEVLRSVRSVSALVAGISILYGRGETDALKSAISKLTTAASAGVLIGSSVVRKARDRKYRQASGSTYNELTTILSTIKTLLANSERSLNKIS